MNYLYRYILLSLFSVLFLAVGCKDKWDEYVDNNDPALQGSLFSRIKTHPELSTFTELLISTGLDTVLSGSQNYTVWAPDNDALQSLDESLKADKERLKAFVANHIAPAGITSAQAVLGEEIKTLAGKNLVFTQTTFDEIPLQRKDEYASNGILHIVKAPVYPQLSLYEFLSSFPGVSRQKEAILRRNYRVLDVINAKPNGIDPQTGAPIYSAEDSIIANAYLQKFPINNEDKKFTYVILTDEAFSSEENKLKGFFETVSGSTDSTTFFTQGNILKDLAFDGIVTVDNLPDSLTSIDGTNIHISKSDIVESHVLSNGVVYVIKKIGYNTAAKLGVKLLQGEEYVESLKLRDGETRGSVTVNRVNPDGTVFRQLRYQNPPSAKFWFRFSPLLNKVKYKVYWRAVRDWNLVPGRDGNITIFPQKLVFTKLDAVAPYDFGYQNVSVKEMLQGTQKSYAPNYDEVYLGEYVSSRFGNESVFLVSNSVTTSGLNSLVLDYIKLVPVVN